MPQTPNLQHLTDQLTNIDDIQLIQASHPKSKDSKDTITESEDISSDEFWDEYAYLVAYNLSKYSMSIC